MADATPGSTFEDRDWAGWFAKNRRNVTIGAIAVAVVAVGIWWFRMASARNEVAAAMALDQARAAAEAGNLPLASSDLARIVDQFKRTKAGAQAAILLAQVRLSQGQTDAAVNGLQGFVGSSHPDYIEASAYNLLGVGLETQGKYREAANAYRRASESARLDFLKAQYLIDVSRTLVAAGDTAGARTALTNLLEEYGALEQAAEARVRLGELGGDVPAAAARPGATN